MLQHVSDKARFVIEQSTKTRAGEIELITNANIRVKNLIDEVIKGIINDMEAQGDIGESGETLDSGIKVSSDELAGFIHLKGEMEMKVDPIIAHNMKEIARLIREVTYH